SGESDRAGRLLASLLRMARLDQGELYRPEPQDIVALCQAEIERLRPRAGALTLRLVEPDVSLGPVFLSGEATRDALANLFDNARRHARSTITVRVTTSQDTLEIF